MKDIKIRRFGPSALKELEALLVLMGFHPAGVEAGPIWGTIFVHEDRLFCLCCGRPLTPTEWDGSLFCAQGHCPECAAHQCHTSVSAEEFLHHHNKINLLIEAVTRP